MSDRQIFARGERTILRRLQPSDLEDFQAYRTDPQVREYQSWEVSDDEKARGFLEAVSTDDLLQPGEWCQIGIALAKNRQLAGDIGIRLDEDGMAAEIGITLSPAHQHGGLATEAIDLAFGWIFASCPATRIYGIADKRNASSIRLMERLGMTFEDEYETEFEGEPCVEVRCAVTVSHLAGNRGPRQK